MRAELPTLPAWQVFPARAKMELMPDNAQIAVSDEDAALMLRAGEGDEAALEKLIDRWKNPLINFFYRSLGSRETSEDLAQMVFIRLYRAGPTYKPSARFSTFIFHIARRLLLNEYRRQQRKPLDTIDPAEIKSAVDGRSGLRLMEIEEAFSHALRNLPEKHRTAILLFKQQELSYKEMAKVMGATESAVKTWIFRARKDLQITMKELL